MLHGEMIISLQNNILNEHFKHACFIVYRFQESNIPLRRPRNSYLDVLENAVGIVTIAFCNGTGRHH